jgi:hypothetical protein
MSPEKLQMTNNFFGARNAEEAVALRVASEPARGFDGRFG